MLQLVERGAKIEIKQVVFGCITRIVLPCATVQVSGKSRGGNAPTCSSGVIYVVSVAGSPPCSWTLWNFRKAKVASWACSQSNISSNYSCDEILLGVCGGGCHQSCAKLSTSPVSLPAGVTPS